MLDTTHTIDAEGPWNPGVGSQLPPSLVPLSTIFRPENATRSVAEARELAELTGFGFEDLVVFRPERLAVHEVLIRVTADLSVPDGNKVEDLGINFRRIAHAILARHVAPRMDEIVAAYDAAAHAVHARIERELARVLAPNAASATSVSTPTRGWRGWFSRGATAHDDAVTPESAWVREERIVGEWNERAQTSADADERAACRALARVVAAVRSKHGQIWGSPDLLARVAAGCARNARGAELIGQFVDPCVRAAAHAEGHHLLPIAPRPVVMNTKGASASGKSTMRPLQKRLAGEIGVEWSDFALISPDIWRKYLLDYGTLGDAYKYAGAFTGKEIAIVDHKLDGYMARKAEHRGMSHLLIDRFRFDSFTSDSDEAGGNLLTRFGHFVYMFFMITPPDQTIDRSWKRGLEVGRYKPVDDLLAHNIEAYTGMPKLFFTWALRENMSVHHEFLDNSVPFGETPRTAAFGRNAEMNVLDVKAMLDIERYRKIDVDARRREDVYERDAMAASRNTQFLVQCARSLDVVNFARAHDGRIYARIDRGKLTWTDPRLLEIALGDDETRAGLFAAAPALAAGGTRVDGADATPRIIDRSSYHTLGAWGEPER